MTFAFPIPDTVLDQLADHVADRLRDQREYLSLAEAAEYLRMPETTLRYRTIPSDTREPIPFRRNGRHYLFVRQELDAWLDRGGGELE